MPFETLGDVIHRMRDPLGGSVSNSNPESTWTGGDLPIPLRVALDRKLTDFDDKVYGFLNRLREISRGEPPFCSEKYIALNLRRSERGVRKSIAKLSARGWIQVLPRGKGRFNRYLLADTVPPAAWSEIKAAEIALLGIRRVAERNRRACHEGNRGACRTGTIESTSQSMVSSLRSETVFSEQPYTEIQQLRNFRALPREKRTQYLDAFKSILRAVADKKQLEELLVYAGTWPRTAKLLCDSFSLVRIREAGAHIPLECKNIGAWLRRALEKGYKFAG